MYHADDFSLLQILYEQLFYSILCELKHYKLDY
jgi:hypothetical protein